MSDISEIKVVCPNCGKVLEEEWRFCPFCKQEQKRPKCIFCKREIEPHWRYCPFCTTKIEDDSTSNIFERSNDWLNEILKKDK